MLMLLQTLQDWKCFLLKNIDESGTHGDRKHHQFSRSLYGRKKKWWKVKWIFKSAYLFTRTPAESRFKALQLPRWFLEYATSDKTDPNTGSSEEELKSRCHSRSLCYLSTVKSSKYNDPHSSYRTFFFHIIFLYDAF